MLPARNCKHLICKPRSWCYPRVLYDDWEPPRLTRARRHLGACASLIHDTSWRLPNVRLLPVSTFVQTSVQTSPAPRIQLRTHAPPKNNHTPHHTRRGGGAQTSGQDEAKSHLQHPITNTYRTAHHPWLPNGRSFKPAYSLYCPSVRPRLILLFIPSSQAFHYQVRERRTGLRCSVRIRRHVHCRQERGPGYDHLRNAGKDKSDILQAVGADDPTLAACCRSSCLSVRPPT